MGPVIGKNISPRVSLSHVPLYCQHAQFNTECVTTVAIVHPARSNFTCFVITKKPTVLSEYVLVFVVSLAQRCALKNRTSGFFLSAPRRAYKARYSQNELFFDHCLLSIYAVYKELRSTRQHVEKQPAWNETFDYTKSR